MIKVGDRVLVKKPANVGAPPVWVEQMDRYDGKELIVRRVEPGPKWVFFDDYGGDNKWAFHFDWLIPVAQRDGE